MNGPFLEGERSVIGSFMEGEGFDPGPDSEDDISWDPDRCAMGEAETQDLVDGEGE